MPTNQQRLLLKQILSEPKKMRLIDLADPSAN